MYNIYIYTSGFECIYIYVLWEISLSLSIYIYIVWHVIASVLSYGFRLCASGIEVWGLEMLPHTPISVSVTFSAALPTGRSPCVQLA